MSDITYHLVQANYGEWDRENYSDDKFVEFSNMGAKIMSQARPENGFIWAAGTSFYGDAAVTQVFDHPDAVLNLSVWQSYEALKQFVYEGDHLSAVKNSRRWFKKLDRKVYALWWIKAGELPTVKQAKEKLDLINSQGISAEAFDFNHFFDAEGNSYQMNH